MTSYILRNASPATTRTDAVVIGIHQTEKGPEIAEGGEAVGKAYGRRLSGLLSSLGATGKAGEAFTVPSQGTIKAPVLVLVGLGRPSTTPPAHGEPDRVAVVRRAAGVAARAVRNSASVALALPTGDAALVRAAIEGYDLGGYTFTTYKKDTAKDADAPGEVVVLTAGARKKEYAAAAADAAQVAEAVRTARDWVNTPPGDLTPPAFADRISQAHGALTKGRGAPKVTLTVHDEESLAELGCGGILGVGKGSAAAPQLVELTYSPSKPKAHLALVGKGVTFDSGGLSIKPGPSMVTMKCDMAGAAAVLAATMAIARLGLPVKVSCFAPLAENMLSGDATRPGDVLRMYGGKTVEVTNTDAEGRLILADALVRATETEPDVILDVATLTGAMVMALGEKVAGVIGDDVVRAAIEQAGTAAGEAYWQMPLPEEMAERVRSSKIADLAQHDAVRWGGGLFAGAFLREFVGTTPWAHLDIAGPAFNSGEAYGEITNGGTGFAVATLVEYARTLAS